MPTPGVVAAASDFPTGNLVTLRATITAILGREPSAADLNPSAPVVQQALEMIARGEGATAPTDKALPGSLYENAVPGFVAYDPQAYYATGVHVDPSTQPGLPEQVARALRALTLAGASGGNVDPGTRVSLGGGETWGPDEKIVLSVTGPFFTASDIGRDFDITGAGGTTVRFHATEFIANDYLAGYPDRTVPSDMRGALQSKFSKVGSPLWPQVLDADSFAPLPSSGAAVDALNAALALQTVGVVATLSPSGLDPSSIAVREAAATRLSAGARFDILPSSITAQDSIVRTATTPQPTQDAGRLPAATGDDPIVDVLVPNGPEMDDATGGVPQWVIAAGAAVIIAVLFGVIGSKR